MGSFFNSSKNIIKNQGFRPRPVFALPGFLGRPRIVLAVRKCPVDTFRHEKTSYFRRRSVFALPGFPGRPMYCPCRTKVSGGHFQARKNLLLS